MKHVSNLIKKIRNDGGLVQADIAKSIGTTTQFVSLLENEKAYLPKDLAKFIIKKYKVDRQLFVDAYLEDAKAEIIEGLR